MDILPCELKGLIFSRSDPESKRKLKLVEKDFYFESKRLRSVKKKKFNFYYLFDSKYGEFFSSTITTYIFAKEVVTRLHTNLENAGRYEPRVVLSYHSDHERIYVEGGCHMIGENDEGDIDPSTMDKYVFRNSYGFFDKYYNFIFKNLELVSRTDKYKIGYVNDTTFDIEITMVDTIIIKQLVLVRMDDGNIEVRIHSISPCPVEKPTILVFKVDNHH